jgi:hypothetical protein
LGIFEASTAHLGLTKSRALLIDHSRPLVSGPCQDLYFVGCIYRLIYFAFLFTSARTWEPMGKDDVEKIDRISLRASYRGDEVNTVSFAAQGI